LGGWGLKIKKNLHRVAQRRHIVKQTKQILTRIEPPFREAEGQGGKKSSTWRAGELNKRRKSSAFRKMPEKKAEF